ncbi:MAG: carbohydrate ABC transporter permease [Christensenellaceae bacterium]|nr:carbohydrate ABC transporter permease [Christensenellaceae bacterium]
MKTNQAAAAVQTKAPVRHKASRSYIMKARAKHITISVLRGLLIFGLCFMIIQPLITRFSTSLMAEKDLYDSTIVVLPRNPTLDNYMHVATLTNFPKSMINTLWASLLVSVLQAVSCTLVGYGFARYDFPLKKFWFACVVALIVIPPQTIQTSLYTFFARFDIFGIFTLITGSPLNLRSSVAPYALMSLTCMGLKDGLYIYMLRQYFRGIPKSLEEAAYVDGCNTLHTFAKIMLPDAIPTIASCFLFSFVWQWTDLFYTRNFLTTSYRPFYATEMSTMVSRMSRYFSADANNPVIVSAARQQQLISIAVLFCCIPLVILYCFTQRTFVQSIAMSGSKE